MKLDGSDLDNVCEYGVVCSYGNYGTKEFCQYKRDCKLYYKMVEFERSLWEYPPWEQDMDFKELNDMEPEKRRELGDDAEYEEE
jgi:hypothetical protein